MSDTPAAAPMARELRNFELGLGSQRAQLGLGATMEMSKQQNAFDQAISEFQQSLAQNKWAAKQGFLFGGGMQGISSIGQHSWGKGTQTNAPSIMSNIGQTFGVLGQGMQLAGAFASPFTSTTGPSWATAGQVPK